MLVRERGIAEERKGEEGRERWLAAKAREKEAGSERQACAEG
jgi:hypothetical protein